ncbi:MAG: ribonuclease R [Bacilli bacterium]|nr:ribonuclease R [Bacilli bacterium]
MEEQIIELLKNSDKALAVDEIIDLLQKDTVEEFKETLKTLNKLEDELKICRTNKNKYMLFENNNLKIGTLIGTKKSYGFVDIEGNEDVFIPPNAMNGAIHNDKVIVEITSKKGIDLEGRIVRIVDRKLNNMVGEVIVKNNQKTVVLDNERVKLNVILDETKDKGAMEGHKVYVKITNKIGDNTYNGEVIKILGHKNDPGVDILSIVYKYDINDTFSDEVMNELDDIPSVVSQDEINKRSNHDLRNMTIFTIDGKDTKDIDDAISIEKLENGHYKLGVHIADVSHYVKEGTALYKEARDRGTSVYLADRVIPMLPHKLSNGICSLNPNVDRLAVTCMMEIDQKGNTVDYDIYESVIKSNIQMTYENVNKILEENIIPEGYEPFVNDLKTMKELADILRQMKTERGYIDFDLDESKIIVNELGEAVDVVLRDRGTGEKLIEDFMIAANETIATHVYNMEFLPFVYRIHGEPSEEKITRFINYVSSCGYTLTGKFDKMYPSSMQKILDQLKEKPEFHIFSSLLLRSMQKAVYDIKNIGHFGLGSKCYTHFTSPIRRFPDTTVHRLLHKYFVDNKMDSDTIDFETQNLLDITEHSSKKERDSVDCERDVDDMKKAEYMQKHIGENFTGMVSSIMSRGMYVELPNLIEGRVSIEDLKDDYYTFDESTISLVGNKNKRGYRLGDIVNVTVKAARKDLGEIDFIITKGQKEEQK